MKNTVNTEIPTGAESPEDADLLGRLSVCYATKGEAGRGANAVINAINLTDSEPTSGLAYC